MKSVFLSFLIAAVTATALPSDAWAKRLGGGKSSGMQRDMPARTAPDAPPARPAAPAQTPPQSPAAQPAAAGAAGAAAAPARRSMMGPLAGLAAGLGLAALASYLGFGEAFANFLLIALLVIVGFVVLRLMLRRFGPQAAPAAAGAQNSARSGAQVAWPTPAQPAPAAAADPVMERRAGEPQALSPQAPVGGAAPALEPVMAPEAAVATAPTAKVFVPASFDSEGFERAAKLIFIRLQAAHDAADLDDLRAFTTPEMFASLRLDIQERGPAAQQTDVLSVKPTVVDVAQEGDKQIVSVRFEGEVRESPEAAAERFNEIWHLVKPLDDSRCWAVAGIEHNS